LLGISGFLLGPSLAHAENLIKRPGAHTRYSTEIEPHLVLEFPDGVGVGARATFVVADRGFITSLNDSVGVGVGMNFIADHRHDVVIPVAMQWNFWFTEQLSAFGEPGIAFALGGGDSLLPMLALGGRLQFSSKIALTLRIGHPLSTIGASFFL
jgi:hypothetical protein